MGADSLKNDLMLFAILMVGLLITMIVAGIVYIAADKLKETACETAGVAGTNTWNGATCQNSTGEASVKAVTQIGVVELAADVALGLLSLFIVILVFGVLLKITIRFAKGFSG